MRRLSTAVAFSGALLVCAAACTTDESAVDDTGRNDDGAIESGGELGVFEIQTGDCFTSSGDPDVVTVTGVPCDEPHEAQAYGAFQLEGEDYPGDDETSGLATEGCEGERRDSFVGDPTAQAVALLFDAIRPTEESWNDLDDREVICVALAADGSELTETVAAGA